MNNYNGLLEPLKDFIILNFSHTNSKFLEKELDDGRKELCELTKANK